VPDLSTSQDRKDQVPAHGLLEPLPIPSQAWEIVTMDFVEGLPQYDRFNAILVVVDKFTKYEHIIPTHHPFTTLQTTHIYMNQVYKLHGLPKAIYLIEIGYSQVLCGSSCLGYRILS
jgi:hypothetical protein